jgi:hypothetical protein
VNWLPIGFARSVAIGHSGSMHPKATDLFSKGIAGALASQSTMATAASFDLAKLIAPASGMKSALDRIHEHQRGMAKLTALADSPLLKATRELAAIPRMGDAFAVSLAVRSEALGGIGETMRKLMQGITCHTPHIGAMVAEMQARTAAITKTLENFRLPAIKLNPAVFDALSSGALAPKFTEGLRLASLALDFPKLTAGFHQFLHESQLAQERLVEPLVAIPPRELFLAGDAGLALELTDPAVEEAESQRETLRAEIDDYLQPALEIVLVRFEPRLVELWRGAREAATARRSDCARHVLTSLRELFREVLARLAPDEKLHAWSTDTADFHNGKPTRSARLRFAMRHLQSPSFTRFLDLDRQLVSEFFKVFDKGTHSIEPPVTARELPFLVRRVEGFLCALVEAHEIGENQP